jgi:hypothetical protein
MKIFQSSERRDSSILKDTADQELLHRALSATSQIGKTGFNPQPNRTQTINLRRNRTQSPNLSRIINRWQLAKFPKHIWIWFWFRVNSAVVKEIRSSVRIFEEREQEQGIWVSWFCECVVFESGEHWFGCAAKADGTDSGEQGVSEFVSEG